MANRTHALSRTLLFSTAALMGASLLAFQAEAAFNPQAESDTGSTRLPDARIISNTPVAGASRYQYAAPVTTIQMPTRPLYPAQAAGLPITYAPPAEPVAVNVVPKAAAQPVAAVARTEAPKAAANTLVAPAAPAPASVAAAPTGFIAPAPVFAVAPPAPIQSPEPLAAPDALKSAIVLTPPPAKVEAAAPVVSPPVVVAAPTVAIVPKGADVASGEPIAAGLLSNESKAILSHVPSKLDTVAQKASKVKMDRVSPDVQSILGKDAKVESYESVGLSIKVRRPGLDANYELGKAYTALMGGDTQSAVDTYRTILGAEPGNQDALFGLAATYHRMGKLDKARPLYGALLKLNPNHREGLNNFLALVSEESPQEALAELARLEDRNPQFSPIPAQTAILLDKLGFVAEAREKMLRAIDLAPDNLTYKYNLAIMLDRQGSYADAGAIYRLLIDSALKGATIPSSVDALQRRLNFITTAAKETPAKGT